MRNRLTVPGLKCMSSYMMHEEQAHAWCGSKRKLTLWFATLMDGRATFHVG